jgi:hypothetical protein
MSRSFTAATARSTTSTFSCDIARTVSRRSGCRDRTWIGFDGEVPGEVVSGFERLPAGKGFPILPHDPIQRPRHEPRIRYPLSVVPLGAISPESLEAEGFESFALFRRAWCIREKRLFRPMHMTTVFRVRRRGLRRRACDVGRATRAALRGSPRRRQLALLSLDRPSSVHGWHVEVMLPPVLDTPHDA